MSPFDLAFGLLKNLVAGTLSIIFIGLIRATFWKRNRTVPWWFLGILFACAAFVGMLFPVVYSPGVFRDFRNSLVALASFYGGPGAGFVSAGISGAFRLYLGGGGTFGGIMGLFSSALLGAIFYKILPENQKFSFRRLPLLGASVFIITFLWSWTLPREQAWTAIQTFFLPELVAYPIVTTLFGSLYQLETDRQTSMEHFRAVFNESPFGTLIIETSAFRIIDANPAFCRMLEYRRSELLNMTLVSIVHPDHLPEIGQAILDNKRAVSGDFKSERTFKKKSGDVLWMNMAATEIRDHAGQVAYIVVLEDITQRKTAEEALQRYLRRLEILHKTDKAILRAQSTEKTIQESLRYVREMTPCRHADVILFDLQSPQKRGGGAEIGEVGGSIASPERLPQIEKLENGETVLFSDLSKSADTGGMVETLRHKGILSFVMIPMKIHDQLIGVLNLGTEEPFSFDKGKIEIACEVANSLAVAIQNTRLVEELTRHRCELKKMSALILEAQEAERKRISFELHDEMGQVLTGISIHLGIIEKMVLGKTNASVRDRLSEAKMLANQASDQIKDLAYRLRPSILDDLGLDPTLRWYVGRYTKRTNIHVDLDVSICEAEIDSDIKTHLYRVTQEGLNNIAKHAGAENVKIRLSCDKRWVILEIEDDGRGFKVDQQRDGATSGKGLGLIGMRERVTFIDGIFSIQSVPGEGTRLTAKVPTSYRGTLS